MTTQDASNKDCKKTGLKKEKSDQRQEKLARRIQLYEKVFQNVHFKNDKSLCNLGTVSESSRWFWESYPV